MTQVDESGSGVTLEALEAYLEGNQRPILGSLLPDQQRVTQMFQSGSTGTPPPPAHVEGGPTPAPAADDDEISGAEDETDEELEDDIGVREVVDEPSSSESAPADDDLIEVRPGVHMTRAAISEALASRESAPEARPSEASTPVGATVEGTTSTPAVAPPPAPALVIPQELLDDPEMGPVVRMLQAQQQDLAETKQQLAYVTDISVARQQEELSARVTAGIHQFRDDKHLDDTQIADINRVAANLNVMPSLASGVDPITGESVPRDPQQAAYRALEIAMWSMPQYRELELAASVTSRAKDQRRKQKLAGISGGSGSVPRTTQVPTDRRSRELAAVTELRELMSPGSEE